VNPPVHLDKLDLLYEVVLKVGILFGACSAARLLGPLAADAPTKNRDREWRNWGSAHFVGRLALVVIFS
jgi:hypothetical protein